MLDKEIRCYRKMAYLARKQLSSIDTSLSSGGRGRLEEYLFKIRHARLKRLLIDVLREKTTRVGEKAILELIEDLKGIGENGEQWCDVTSEETDYIRFVLHGIKQSPPAEKDSKCRDENAKQGKVDEMG